MDTLAGAAAWVQALETAYPQRIGRVERRGEDWALQVGSRWFYWAGARLLPEELMTRAGDYDPHPFYWVELDPSRRPAWTDEQVRQIERQMSLREADPPRRHPGFFDALWRVQDETSAYARMKSTFFLGRRLEIHRELLEDLAAVEEEILELAVNDAEVRRFIAGLSSVEGYNWRPIAGTASRSAHSYGMAVDLLPRSYGGRQAYWRWSRQPNRPWFRKAWDNRWMPPQKVIEAFETRGWVWGGRWTLFDTIHFEYRPELLPPHRPSPYGP